MRLSKLIKLSMIILNLSNLLATIDIKTSDSKVNNMKIGYWSTWKIKCGIAMYTKHIKDSLTKLNFTVFNYPHNSSLYYIATLIEKDKINVLNIQYEQMIMPPLNVFLNFINNIKSKNIKIVVTMHNEPDFAQKIVDASDITIYHKQPEKLEDRSKVRVIPMAVPVFTPSGSRIGLRKKYGFKATDKVLVSTGFLFHTKEISKNLEALAPLIKKDANIKLQLIHPFSPMDPIGSQLEYEKLIEVIIKHDIIKQVLVITKFLPQKELSERIYLSDLGYQWFKIDTGATSASGKEYITARTPLIVPDSSHFHDLVCKGIIKTPKKRGAFIQAVKDLLSNPYKLAAARHHLSNLYLELNYDNWIKRYCEIVFNAQLLKHYI